MDGELVKCLIEFGGRRVDVCGRIELLLNEGEDGGLATGARGI
jgi:hypothetical protein